MKIMLSPFAVPWVIVAGLIIVLIMLAVMPGCCTTHYTPVPSASIQPPGKRPTVPVEIWSIQDPVTKKAKKVVVIDADKFFLVEASFKIDDRFIKQCLDLIGPKQ